MHFSQHLDKIAHVSYSDLETLNYALILLPLSSLINNSLIICVELQTKIFPLEEVLSNQNVISIKRRPVKLHCLLNWLNHTE